MTYGFADVQCYIQVRIRVAAEYGRSRRPCFRSGAVRVRSLEYKRAPPGSPTGIPYRGKVEQGHSFQCCEFMKGE
jgi:hypothetical protein